MAAEIRTNDWVDVTVKAEPRSQGGRKTLVRMMAKDPSVRKDRERMKKRRPVGEHQRGGRMWQDRPPPPQADDRAPRHHVSDPRYG